MLFSYGKVFKIINKRLPYSASAVGIQKLRFLMRIQDMH